MAKSKWQEKPIYEYDYNYQIRPMDEIIFKDGKQIQIWKISKEMDIGYSELHGIIFKLVEAGEVADILRAGKPLAIKCNKKAITVKEKIDSEGLFSGTTQEKEEMEFQREKAEKKYMVEMYKNIHHWDDLEED